MENLSLADIGWPQWRGTLKFNLAIEHARACSTNIFKTPSDASQLELKVAMGHDLDLDTEWRGLVLSHAQVQLQNFWSRYGPALDQGMRMWDEQSIRFDVQLGERWSDGT